MSYEELQRSPYRVFQELYYKFWNDNKDGKKDDNVDEQMEDLMDAMS